MDFIRRARGERFKSRDGQAAKELPDGLWEKCFGCRELIYAKELDASLRVCPRCGYHHRLSVWQRIEMLADPGSFEEIDRELRSVDTLGFTIRGKTYQQRLPEVEAAAGVPEALVSGRATLESAPVILAAMVMEFLGGAVGAVVGEKVTRAAERACDERRGLVIVSQSGGMRLHEGLFSLMQMAKASGALARLHRARLPFISVLTFQVYGGTTASWGSLGDVILAEPGARVGFSGPRVLQAIKVKLQEETQGAEFMLEHGMIDRVVPRGELRATIGTLLRHYGGALGPCRDGLVGAASAARAATIT